MPLAPAKVSGEQQGLARQILDVCLSVKSGERVWINSWDHTLGLASQLAWECRKRGCEILTTIQQEDLWLRSIIEAPFESFDRLPKHMVAALEKTDVYIYTLGPSRPVPWEKIPKERRKFVTRWFLEDNNFVKVWKTIAKAKARILARIISGEGEARITTPNGTDFKFRLDRRPADDGYGLADQKTVQKGRVVFIPAGGVETSASEDSGQGRIVFDAPILSLVKEGRIERLTLKVKDGRILESSADSNSSAFHRWLKGGSGDIDRFGFFGFGLNT